MLVGFLERDRVNDGPWLRSENQDSCDKIRSPNWEGPMFRKPSVFAVLLLPWLASEAGADCNRPEYLDSRDFAAPCTALGIDQESEACTKERLAIAKSDLDWVLFGNTAALEAYRASVKEQRDCGFSMMPVIRDRALWVAVKA